MKADVNELLGDLEYLEPNRHYKLALEYYE